MRDGNSVIAPVPPKPGLRGTITPHESPCSPACNPTLRAPAPAVRRRDAQPRSTAPSAWASVSRATRRPDFLKSKLCEAVNAPDGGLATYPATAGTPELKKACATWMQRRYGLSLDPATQILPVLGSREALFALAQTGGQSRADLRRRRRAGGGLPQSLLPDLRGRGHLSGAQPWFGTKRPERNFAVDWASVPGEVWQRTQLLYTCSPAT